MELNLIGPASAAATFFAVWLGHVSVRKIEREVERIWIPSLIAFASGIGLEIASLFSASQILSAVFAIVGVTLLWDSLEFFRQQKRVKVGHAPANPNNPRHAKILHDHSKATTMDWLDRDPRGRPFSPEELHAVREQSQ